MEKNDLVEQPKPGALEISIAGTDEGTVILDFSTGVKRLSFNPQEALSFAASIVNTVAVIVAKGKAAPFSPVALPNGG